MKNIHKILIHLNRWIYLITRESGNFDKHDNVFYMCNNCIYRYLKLIFLFHACVKGKHPLLWTVGNENHLCGLNVGQNFAKQESPCAQAWCSWNACMVVCIQGIFCGENYVKYNKDTKTGEHVLMSSCPHNSFYFCNPRHWNLCSVLLLF